MRIIVLDLEPWVAHGHTSLNLQPAMSKSSPAC